jgi:O-antigen ligase
MFETVSQNRSFLSRIQLYKHNLQAMKSHPVSGIGTHNYPLYAMAPNASSDASEFVNTPLKRFISVIIEKGFAGLAAYVAVLAVFFLVAFRRLVKISRCRPGALNENDVFSRAALVAFIAAMSAVIAHQLTYYASIGNEGTAALEWAAYAVVESLTIGTSIKDHV